MVKYSRSVTWEGPANDRYDIAARLRAVIVPLNRMLRQQTAGLTATQSSVLGSVHRHGPVRLTDLAELERLSGPMISKVVAALEEHGLVERVRDPGDGRSFLIGMSAAGDRWLIDSRHSRERWLAEQLARLDDDELAAVAAALPVLGRLTSDGG